MCGSIQDVMWHPDPVPYLYQYGVGGIVFALGMYVGHARGCWSFEQGRREGALGLIAVFLGYAILQGFFQFVAPGL